MSDEKPKIDEKPRRYLKDFKGPMRMACYLQVRKMSFGELRVHFAEHYPDVDFDSLEIGGIQLRWEDDPTLDEQEERGRQIRAHDERHEKWERETYARLRAKFEPVSALEMTE